MVTDPYWPKAYAVMRNRLALIGLLVAALLTLSVMPALADVHTWGINEVFSNADGSVQFIEMRELFGFDGQDNLATTAIFAHTFDTNAASFTYPNDLSSTLTSNQFFLMATAGFESLPGGVTPDYTIPSQFFSVTGDMLVFSSSVSTLIFTGGELPTDGMNSLFFGGGIAVNSPTNFAGDTGSVIVPEPATCVLAGLGLGALLACRWRRQAKTQ